MMTHERREKFSSSYISFSFHSLWIESHPQAQAHTVSENHTHPQSLANTLSLNSLTHTHTHALEHTQSPT